MQYRLQNNTLTAIIKDMGAELCSLMDSKKTEYIWTGDSRYWPRQAPILFPIVGKVLNGTYNHKDKDYTIGQHGFARDYVFTVTHQTETSITFMLQSSEGTHASYPFDFKLSVTYTLVHDTLEITYDILNTAKEVIGFKIGAHPGFRCPLFEDERMEDYYFEFGCEENATLMPLVEGGFFDKTKTSSFTSKTIDISPDIFANDAIVLTDLKSSQITLRSHKHNSFITLGFQDFPFLGLWSTSTPSPFVCIEPWFGHGDFISDSEVFMEKEDLVTLAPGKHFSCTHTMTIHA